MPRTATLIYPFEELPLIIDAGFESGLVNGSAEIEFDADGGWGIVSIALDGHRPAEHTEEQRLIARLTGRALPQFVQRLVTLDPTSPIHGLIYHRLEHEWRDNVQTAVRETLNGLREAAE